MQLRVDVKIGVSGFQMLQRVTLLIAIIVCILLRPSLVHLCHVRVGASGSQRPHNSMWWVAVPAILKLLQVQALPLCQKICAAPMDVEQMDGWDGQQRKNIAPLHVHAQDERPNMFREWHLGICVVQMAVELMDGWDGL